MLSLLRAQVQSLVGELRSHKSCSVAQKKKKSKGEMRTFPDKQELREFVTTRPACKKCSGSPAGEMKEH